MARIPLEDNLEDVIRKAQRGWKITDEQLAERAGVSPADLAAVQQGKPVDAVVRRIARHLQLSPAALEDLAHKRWHPRQPDFPRGFMMFNSPYKDVTVNSYLVWDSRTKLAAAFDTGSTSEPMINEIRAAGLQLRDIFITHTHPDHIAGLPELARATGAQVWSSELEPIDHPGARTFKEFAHFHLGELSIKTLLTAGHSPGQTTYFVTGLRWPVAFVGDAVFASSMGSSSTGFKEQLRSNRVKIFTLQRDTVLACGHGPLTTLAEEKQHNPFFAR